ncbi:Fur family transcriptional regulator, iron response regulator [Albimonas donghaensis]|uniref:Ferric uptake regulation protein n=2 Tax=Albimonas donghaensis TaxID=356660 RepID=A0A1H2YQL8_9RHOB|nr:Fur family transcriptional regulator, iron response regulator [Albimonas donghaensis]
MNLLKRGGFAPYSCLMDQLSTAMGPDAQTRAGRWLSRAGLRPTRQRRALALLLAGDGRNRHVTAETLHDAAQGLGEPVSLATVYNTLRSFTEAGLLAEITVDGARSYYDTRIEDHPHFYWEDDGRLTDAPRDSVKIERLPEAPEGTEISKVDVVIRLRTR